MELFLDGGETETTGNQKYHPNFCSSGEKRWGTHQRHSKI
jgi:hypothetical protein